MKTLDGLTAQELIEMHNAAYDHLQYWLAPEQRLTVSERQGEILQTYTTVSKLHLQAYHLAMLGSVEDHLALYWNLKEFSDFNEGEFSALSKTHSTLLLSLAKRDKNADEHRMFFEWMRQRLDTIGLSDFYKNYGVIALGGYLKTVSVILGVLLVQKLNEDEEDEAEEWKRDAETDAVKKQQLEWLLDHFVFAKEIKEHDLDPLELIAEKKNDELLAYAELIGSSVRMTKILLRDFEEK